MSDKEGGLKMEHSDDQVRAENVIRELLETNEKEVIEAALAAVWDVKNVMLSWSKKEVLVCNGDMVEYVMPPDAILAIQDVADLFSQTKKAEATPEPEADTKGEDSESPETPIKCCQCGVIVKKEDAYGEVQSEKMFWCEECAGVFHV